MPLLPLQSEVAIQVEPVKIFLWQLTESVEELIANLSDNSILSVPPYQNFKSEKRKIEWLAVRALLKQVLSPSIRIEYMDTGRPYLSPAISNISISHTKGIVGVALSRDRVGMDLESIGERAYLLRNHFLTPDEMDYAPVMSPEIMAVMMWSAKESVYKLYDIPGSELKADISLEIIEEEENYVLFKSKMRSSERWAKVKGFRMNSFVLTVASFF